MTDLEKNAFANYIENFEKRDHDIKVSEKAEKKKKEQE
jgi:hypothetical protein